MRNRQLIVWVLVHLLLLGSAVTARGLQATRPLDAPPAPAAPASAPAPGVESMRVVVAEVKNHVEVSTDDGKTWKPAVVGMELNEGASFRTGLRSSVSCVIPPDQSFTLESLSTIRVQEAVKRGTKVRTDLIMKYGAASYGIEAAGAEHESIIRTPGGTLGVRGTKVRVTDRPGFPPSAESFTGRALFKTPRGGATYVGGRHYAAVRAGEGTAAQTALDQSVVDPSLGAARTASDRRFIAEEVSRGGLLSFDTRANIPVIRGGPGPLPDSALPGALPGRLDFVLRWTGPANLDLVVESQKGDQFKITQFNPNEILYPGYGMNVSASGGRIPYDDRGGKHGGMEVGYWDRTFPTGLFGVGVLHSGGATSPYTINAYLDGKPLKLFYLINFDQPNQMLVKSTAITGTLVPHDEFGALVYVPGNSFFESHTPDNPNGTSVDPTVAASAARYLASAEAQKKTASAKPQSGKVGVAGPMPMPAGMTGPSSKLAPAKAAGLVAPHR